MTGTISNSQYFTGYVQRNVSSENLSYVETKLKEAKDKQGFLGNIWNGFKEVTNLGQSASDCDSMVKKFKMGKISFEEAVQYIEDFENKQDNMADLFSNVLTGTAAIAATVATSGVGTIGLATALKIGAPVGAIAKTALGTVDRATNNVEGDEFDTKEPLVVAVQLWKEKAQSQMSMALELSGLQISKWFGGGRTKKNYYCPKEITAVFAWRIYLMTVLNAIEKSETLMDFNQTYGKWHEKARKELNDILKCQYSIISNYDENKEREIEKLVNGNNFKVSSGNKDVVISNFVGKFVTDIPVMTIHGSKGCTYDTTLVISSENAQSEGGHWKAHWIEGDGEAKRIGYVASTRAKYLLVWGVPILKKKDRELLENYGFISSEEVTNDVENEECT